MKKLLSALLLFCSQVFAGPADFTYHKIFGPNNIPGTGGATVSAAYSPAVFKQGGRYFMFFGVSLSCRNGAVARDSIGYAVSLDGINNWVWMGYIIEPNTTVCLLDPSQWFTGAVYQVNDPTVRVDGDTLTVAYTSVLWKFPSAQRECGIIGTALFDLRNFPLQAPYYRNDRYMEPSAAECVNTGGFSRPTYRKLNDGTYEMWVDSAGAIVRKIVVTSATSLNPAGLVNTGAQGADIEVYESDGCLRLLRNGNGGLLQSVFNGSTWSTWQFITENSRQGWDSWQHGSPQVFDDGKYRQIYLSGAVQNPSNGWYQSLNIGVAVPRNQQAFGSCQ